MFLGFVNEWCMHNFSTMSFRTYPYKLLIFSFIKLLVSLTNWPKITFLAIPYKYG